ncbi:MAG: hypothetical protein A2X34_03630 [Elusimicrobia bacterium GWC2_51_8]|nr:MAG: hypothetical protein A2X33_08725 [Elusimicrobia bacterium GWA2_51_34]OGR61758.1 MAG: hypothetical protein A2X34_03630 [Elusimicrobia bacterium GWC2_51_8]OGR87065.1 MAG: hypothetical protein A2021_02910 [Elusimicrobia bacterium GWF2_52_66]HAF96042.1 hypothetical protein [Elusimicrobiota bacterium]HCE98651.1 hypothetical protein [Elusimicrobiota bacterium]
MECKKEINLKTCACTYDPCPRKGVCCECVTYHRANGELPGCLFSPEAERTYDRSFKHFADSVKKDLKNA